MLIHIRKQATTTPKVRASIQASTEPAPMLAEGIVRGKWLEVGRAVV